MTFRFSKVRIPRAFTLNSLKLTLLGPILPRERDVSTLHWKRFEQKNENILPNANEESINTEN